MQPVESQDEWERRLEQAREGLCERGGGLLEFVLDDHRHEGKTHRLLGHTDRFDEAIRGGGASRARVGAGKAGTIVWLRRTRALISARL